MNNTNSNWKTEYFRFLEENNEDEEYKIKMQHFPKHFYKYISLNDYTFSSIANSEVFLANASELNDPYECLYSIDIYKAERCYLNRMLNNKYFLICFRRQYGCDFPSKYIDEVLTNDKPYHHLLACYEKLNIKFHANADEIFKDKLIKCQKLVENYRKKISICCFSCRNDSILMWSHYANEHKGICIEYDFMNENDLKKTIQPVHYSDNQYDITDKVSPYFNPSGISLGTYIASLTKATDWQYENEWRLINNINIKKYAVPKPTAIYLGIRFIENEKKDEILTLAKKYEIQIIQMKLNSSKYIVES